MPRTITTVINDVMRMGGKLHSLSASWEIPVPRDGWNIKVSVSVDYTKHQREKTLHVSVTAYGGPVLKPDDEYRGLAHYWALNGYAAPRRLTRKWVETVLREGIETAYLAAQSFTESDLRERGFKGPTEAEIEEYRQQDAYFESTLKV